ncbi:unnamed protein product [Fusarium graminearum]|nr:unnamed protein product [Fusarium graminearum]
MVTRSKGLDDAAEFDTQRLGCLRWKRVKTSTLDYVHAVNSKGLDLDNSLTFGSRRLGRLVIDEEGITLASAASDICEVGYG